MKKKLVSRMLSVLGLAVFTLMVQFVIEPYIITNLGVSTKDATFIDILLIGSFLYGVILCVLIVYIEFDLKMWRKKA